jgi:hypothetical protein
MDSELFTALLNMGFLVKKTPVIKVINAFAIRYFILQKPLPSLITFARNKTNTHKLATNLKLIQL